jgi:hypothetical protein
MMIPATAANEIPTGLGGLGALSLNPTACSTYSDPVTGKIIDCDAIWGNGWFPNMLNPTCWGMTSANCAPAGSVVGSDAPNGGAATVSGDPSDGGPTVGANPICALFPMLCDSTGQQLGTMFYVGAALAAGAITFLLTRK